MVRLQALSDSLLKAPRVIGNWTTTPPLSLNRSSRIPVIAFRGEAAR